MAGEAKTQRVMLASATLMLGQLGDLMNLNPTAHSVGLVKNFTLTTDPAFLNLEQGRENTIVYTVMTKNDAKATAEVYEYTAANLSYAAGLDGSTVTTATTSAATINTAGVDANSLVTAFDVANGAGAAFSAGQYVIIQKPGANDDDFQIRVIDTIDAADGSKDTINITLPYVGYFPVGTVIQVVNSVDVGTTKDGIFLSAKAVGKLPDGSPMGILLPKVRITKGFNVAFNVEQWGNLPFELTVMDQLPTDPFYASFIGKKAALFIP